MGDVVAGFVILANWDPRYLNLLQNSVNLPSPTEFETALAEMPPSILLDPISDCDVEVTAILIRHNIYVPQPQPFVPILLARELIPSKTWERLQGAIITEKLDSDCRAVIDWLWVALVHYAPNTLSPLIASDLTNPLSNYVLLKHPHTVIIHNIMGINPDVILAMGYLIATNIGLGLRAEVRTARGGGAPKMEGV